MTARLLDLTERQWLAALAVLALLAAALLAAARRLSRTTPHL